MRFETIMLPLFSICATAYAADPATAHYYKTTCAICHGEKGEGIPQLGPALKGNEFVKTAEVADTITRGREGEQKRYKDLASPMPPHAISGKKLQDLIEYLRTDLQR